ncbi:hypothetical protein BH09SUM1_BH09SUM1_24380 [soil metagenome]
MGLKKIISRLRKSRGFILLEVLIAVVIIGLAVVALMHGFIVSLDSLSRIRKNEIAIELGKSLLDDCVLEPPGEGNYEGKFSDDPRYGEAFKGWHWKLEVEAEEPDYDERPRGTLLQDLEELYPARLEISFEQDGRDETYLELHTILLDPELFSNEALQQNQLF